MTINASISLRHTSLLVATLSDFVVVVAVLVATAVLVVTTKVEFGSPLDVLVESKVEVAVGRATATDEANDDDDEGDSDTDDTAAVEASTRQGSWSTAARIS